MIYFSATGRSAFCTVDEAITTGSEGMPITFSFSSEWNGLSKVAVFRAGNAKVDVVLTGTTAVVPPNVLTTAGEMLVVGVHGTDGENIIIPTVYAKAGYIMEGTAPTGITPTPTTQPLIDQLIETAEDALEVAQSVRDDADAGVFDGAPGADGNSIWWTTDAVIVGFLRDSTRLSYVNGRVGATPQAKDLLVGPAPGTTGTVAYLYSVTGVENGYVYMDEIGSIKGDRGQQGQQGQQGPQGEDGAPGEDGVSPEVTITEITGGHRITITDADHPSGQTVDVMDGATPTIDATLSNEGEAADAAATGAVKDMADRHDAELLAITPAVVSSNFTWTLNRNWNSSGGYGNADGFARTNYIDVNPGVVVQNLSPAKDANDKSLSFLVHEFNGTTWLRRTGVQSGGYVVVGENATKVSIAFGYPSSQGVTITQELIDASFKARIVTKPSSGGGGGTSDYTDLTNKPSINSVTLSGNKTLSDLGIAAASAVPSAATATPADLGTAAVGSSAKFAREDHVHKKPTYSKSDVGLGNVDNVQQYSATNPPPYPVTSVNGSTGAVSLSIPSTAGDVGAIPAPASPSAGDVLTYSSGAWAAAAPVHELPAGGNSGAVLAKTNASDYQVHWRTISDYTAAGIIITAAATAAKVCQYSFWDDTHYPQILYITLASANTAASALTLKVNGKGPYPIYINGTASSATNYTLPAGSYFVYFDGSKFDFRTDGKIPGDIIGHADKDIQAPASPTTGDFLCWNGSAWAATTLSAWQGGNY